PNPEKVLREFDNIVERLQSLGVEVIVLESTNDMPKTSNMIFLRDVAMSFRSKIVLANMKHQLRGDEPEKFRRLLLAKFPEAANLFVDLDDSFTMEGADIFVINDNLLYVYTGNRTSRGIDSALQQLFPDINIEII